MIGINRLYLDFGLDKIPEYFDFTDQFIEDWFIKQWEMEKWCVENIGLESYPYWQFSTKLSYRFTYLYSGIYIQDDSDRMAFKLRFLI